MEPPTPHGINCLGSTETPTLRGGGGRDVLLGFHHHSRTDKTTRIAAYKWLRLSVNGKKSSQLL